ncbi:conserved phage C-terminal domain-containing protein [Macrococcus equipercicus]|uniref:Conserved phage C-terminal domain-containing protein n=1 Tax=Macrococcus equipercicus TaxID=69967 RepID=A0A9Q9BTI1_9STAP|nr:conserved phage C-terminal domain-containing protein [Macrococcus equipercicus]UTH14064.1 conserved phage C-terminal domain-containing protein [Macrococcus equipercicus]
MGDLEGGAYLSQLVYWSDKGQREDGYFYKSYKDWKDEMGLSQYKVNKLARILQQRDLLKTKTIKAEGSPTVHYKLDKTNLTKAIIEFIKELQEKKRQEELEKQRKALSEVDYQKFDNGKLNIKQSIVEDLILENELLNNEISKISYSSITENTSKSSTKNTQEGSESLIELKRITKKVINYLNNKAETTFSPIDTFNIRLVEQLLKNGYTENDLIKVIDKKYQEWSGNEKTESWIRPSTLFKLEKFNDYLNQKVPHKKEESNFPVPAFIKEIEQQEKQKREVEEQSQKNAPELDPLKSEVRKQIEEL